jgi:hypothetical protein
MGGSPRGCPSDKSIDIALPTVGDFRETSARQKDGSCTDFAQAIENRRFL